VAAANQGRTLELPPPALCQSVPPSEYCEDLAQTRGRKGAVASTQAGGFTSSSAGSDSTMVGAKKLRPDIVLCDLAMPGMDGCHMAESLRRHGAYSLLVAVTAHGDDEHRRRAASAGFHAHFVKPVEPNALRRLLEAQAANLPGSCVYEHLECR
jgi:CheY-like chemotaxis protein